MAQHGRDAMWAVGLAALVVGVLLFAPLAVSLDGYSHLYQAWLLKGLLGGDPQLAERFSVNSALLPNWLTALSLLALGTVFEPETSLKIAIAGAFVALLGGLWFACRGAAGEVRGLSFVVLIPFALAGFLTMGFLGYVWSCGLVLFALGLLLAPDFARSARRQAGFAGLLVGAYFFHPLPVAISFFFCPAALWRARSLRALAPWAPAGLLFGWFTAHFANARSLTWVLSPDLLFVERLISTARPDQLIDVAPTPTAVIPFAVLLGALGAIAVSARPLSPVLWAAGLAAVMYVVTPDGTGDASMIDVRLLWWAIALLAVAALAPVSDRRIGMLCAVLSSGIVLLFCGEYLLVSVRLEPAVRRVREAAERLPAGTPTLVLGYRLHPGCREWGLAERTAPQRHWPMLAAVDRGLVVLNDYQPAATHFPVRYRDQATRMPIDELRPPPSPTRQAWAKALMEQDAGGAEAVLVWGAPNALDTDCGPGVEPPLTDALGQQFEKTYEAREPGYVAIWRRRRAQ
ncbi:MAG: hypothetical protein KDC27_16655 [Acidobacteria bacterium]|nr:hypothetical protein [Acidobacteriota bacterium]